MSPANQAEKTVRANRRGWYLLLFAMLVTGIIYSAGLSGSYLFDDYPNIVDNHAVQPTRASVPSLVGAALSSSSSEFKRPLASLSFAANYLASGLNPYWMKLTNLIIHLLNGLLVFLLVRALLQAVNGNAAERSRTNLLPQTDIGIVAALTAAGWMLLPINLTGVLYVVQRMESMANLFVLLGLLGYIAGRRRMLGIRAQTSASIPTPASICSSAPVLFPTRNEAASNMSPLPADKGTLGHSRFSPATRGLILSAASITLPTALGILAKETAVMLPLYALLIEWMLFHFAQRTGKRDWLIILLFLIVLILPMMVGLAWLMPGIFNPEAWATRDFTLRTRLLSEARIVTDYIRWTVLPTPDVLSFYHDDFRISSGLLTPWTTLACILFLVALIALMLWTRQRQPLVALGIALFLGCHLLTGTVLPLELIYEHRNYFASFGLMLVVIPLLAVPRSRPFSLPRHALLAGLALCWTGLTAMTAYAWGDPLRLSQDLAIRAPLSPRAQYELGRTYIIYSHYDPSSPFTRLAYAPLERAAALPNSSILPEQALIFMNARMHLPLKDAWWDSIRTKLKAHKPGVQDESSLGALTQCVLDHQCNLPTDRMMESFGAALSHPEPSARLLANYGDYAWNALDDHALGERMVMAAVEAAPNEPAYQVTLIRMLAAMERTADARAALDRLKALNIGGRLNQQLTELRNLPGLR
jgi:hypothetical protein